MKEEEEKEKKYYRNDQSHHLSYIFFCEYIEPINN
jgi:hypothetical protein